MKKLRAIPIPFLILFLAGVVSLFSVFAEPGTHASANQNGSPVLQTVEQESAAAVYFRVLSWLSDVTAPREVQPASTAHSAMSARHVVTLLHGVVCPARIEFCSLHLTQPTAAKCQRQALN